MKMGLSAPGARERTPVELVPHRPEHRGTLVDLWRRRGSRRSLGHLLPGHVFSWQNLAAYGVGVLAGAALDRILARPFAT
jgi:hypothetical protein